MVAIPFPESFPCRINEHGRAIHCSSCEIVPGLLAKIKELKQKLEESKEMIKD